MSDEPKRQTPADILDRWGLVTLWIAAALIVVFIGGMIWFADHYANAG